MADVPRYFVSLKAYRDSKQDNTAMQNGFSAMVLDLPIEVLGFSKAFKQVAGQLGFQTLSQMLQHKPYDLNKLPGFDYRLLFEYVNFLEDEGLGHLLN